MYFHFKSTESSDFIRNFLSTKSHAIISSDWHYKYLSFALLVTLLVQGFVMSDKSDKSVVSESSAADFPMDGDPDISIHLRHTPSPRARQPLKRWRKVEKDFRSSGLVNNLWRVVKRPKL